MTVYLLLQVRLYDPNNQFYSKALAHSSGDPTLVRAVDTSQPYQTSTELNGFSRSTLIVGCCRVAISNKIMIVGLPGLKTKFLMTSWAKPLVIMTLVMPHHTQKVNRCLDRCCWKDELICIIRYKYYLLRIWR